MLLAALSGAGLPLAACGPARAPGEPVVIDAAAMQAFADDFFPRRMKKRQISGLTFIFVQGGEVVYAQGYGVANLETQAPVDPASTVFRIGSVSKAFVATAVMQLVEQGTLDLHADVNDYLKAFQLEDAYSEPVTLADLLTHTAGFEDPPYLSNTNPNLVEPLAAHLAVRMPARKHPPGADFVYSNYGYALAALVVEEVSGMPFDQYVERNIFEPLGMTHSHYLLAPPVPENMATGYQYVARDQVAQPLDWDSDYPGGSIVSTAGDMAPFMLVHLRGGLYPGAYILGSEGLAQMHQRQAETGYEGQSVTYGFVESPSDGARLIGHSSAIRGFGSSLNLLPEHDMGYFFSFNAECYETSACQIILEFRQEFLEQFFR